MKRFSYDFLEPDEDAHWTDDLYAIRDAQVGFSDEVAIAWAWDSYNAERIVDALNLADEQRRTVAKPKNDFEDLLG